MKSITIHGLDNTIKKHSKNDFDKFYGIWSKKDTREFDKAVSDFEKIDRFGLPHKW